MSSAVMTVTLLRDLVLAGVGRRVARHDDVADDVVGRRGALGAKRHDAKDSRRSKESKRERAAARRRFDGARDMAGLVAT